MFSRVSLRLTGPRRLDGQRQQPALLSLPDRQGCEGYLRLKCMPLCMPFCEVRYINKKYQYLTSDPWRTECPVRIFDNAALTAPFLLITQSECGLE
jgi:hypothetical protein